MTQAHTPGPGWDAGLYDSKHSFVWKHGASLVELLAPRAGERIVDLGCGTGHLTAQLAAAGAEVVGLDNSPAMIAQAQQTYPALPFELADARAFTVPEPVDAVFSNAALHWITEPERVIGRVQRALKPGGRFVAEFGGRGNVQAITVGMESAAQEVLGSPLGNPWYFPGVADYATLLERHGLEVTFAELFDRPTPLEGEAGMRHWVAMFGGHWLGRVPPERHDDFLRRVEEELRLRLHRDGSWFADYRRLRVRAWRPNA